MFLARPRSAPFVLLFALLLGLAPSQLAAQANPALIARVQGIDSERTQSRSLEIHSLDMRVRLHGTIAETTITAKFANPGRETLEGDFTLQMPAGSVVTGYALDIGDRLVDGVLVDQRQGRIAYEARVRQRIDPGLAEVSRDNQFRTRIFPIFPGSGRTVRLSFTTPLDPRTGYVLPIANAANIGTFFLDIQASGAARAPELRLPSGVSGRWAASGDGGHRLTLTANNVKLDGDLAIAAPEPAAPMLTSRHPNGERFFQIADSAGRDRGEAEPVRSVAILWDRSLSRADDDLAEEIAILTQYLDRVRPQSIDLILFDSSGAERVRLANSAAVVARLRGLRYRGASSLAVLSGQQLSGTDACLLFSDGLVTIDARDDFRTDCPIFALSSADDADRAYLASLARRSGGEAYDLSVREAGEVLTRMTRRVPRVVDVRSSGGAAIDYTLLDGGEYGWRLVGPMSSTGDIIVRLSGIGQGIVERVYSAQGTPGEAAGAASLWAANRVAIRSAGDDRDREAIVAFSRRYSVASPDVSFIVLETGRDYAMARFDPPANLPPQLLEEYRAVRTGMKEEETRQRSQRLATILGQWEEMRSWWSTRFNPASRPKPANDGGGRGRMPPPPPPPPVPMAPPPPPPPPSPPPPIASAPMAQESGDRIVLTGSRIENRSLAAGSPLAVIGQSQSQSRGTISVEPWAPDRPYLQALNEASTAQRDRVFADEQAKHGSLPAFWLDVADWQFQGGRRADAIASVLSALDLPTRNNQTLSIVADRLMRYGEIDRAIWLYERLLAAEDDRPQPRRTLALALAKRAENAPREQARADLARALSLLTEVVMTPWSGAYDGIEMISLMEANRLIPRYRALGGDQLTLDPRLIALLDVDLRVVIEWNSEATDVDLWVDEASGERAIYHNPHTAVGGRLSNDMTQGFGPEEYLLRRAPSGAYEVRANVFAADRLSPNGAQRVSARLIRDFGRPTEREEVVDIELLPDDETRERRVGRIVFGPQAR